MDLKVFAENYNLKDGAIIGFEPDFSSLELFLDVELCGCMQPGFTEEDDEVSRVRFVFSHVADFSIPEEFMFDDGIVDQLVEEGKLIITLVSSETQKPYQVIIEATEVDLSEED